MNKEKNESVQFIRQDTKNEFINYYRITKETDNGEHTEFIATIGQSLLYKGHTEEEVFNWVYDNPVKIAICFFMEFQNNVLKQTITKIKENDGEK